MSDRLGGRARIGILVPAFNTTVQPETEALRPPGVTNHVARIDMPDGDLLSDADQEAVVRSLGDDLFGAIGRVMAARPAIIVMGISIPTFWNGIGGMTNLKMRLEDRAGVPVILGSEACLAALRCFPNIRRLGIVTPYQPIGDSWVKRFFEEAGFDVAIVHSLKRPRGSAIAEADAEMLAGAMDVVAAEGIDLALQVGTNLAFADLVEQESRRIGLPVVAINTALYWMALRRLAINDTVTGFGTLLREH
jgi:maleate isomerase